MKKLEACFAGRTFSMLASAACEQTAASILTYVGEAISEGALFEDGTTIQIGWQLLMLSETDKGHLEFFEPQLGSLSINWVRGVESTVRHLLVQREVCEQIDVEPDFPSLQQGGVVSPRFLYDNRTFEMSRDEPQDSDSGWVFREWAYTGQDAAFHSLFEIASASHAAIPFLALPPGSTVTREADEIAITFSGLRTSSDDNPFLRQLLTSAFFAL